MIRYASFGRRLWAFLLSLLLDLVVLGALYAYTGGADVTAPFLFWYLLHHVGLVVEGGTLGHRLAGLRIVALSGERVGIPQAIVRELVRVFASIPPLGLGVLWMLDEPQRRTWHDLAAGSIVVRELTPDTHLAPDWADSPPWRRRRAEAAVVPAGPAEPPTPPPPGDSPIMPSNPA
jgi:uncharacterized RDD family membrane protein YckC